MKKIILTLCLFGLTSIVYAQRDESPEFQKAKEYYDNEDYKSAFSIFEKAANIGNAYAQCCLGVMYENGDGVERDYSTAVKWYTKSAEQGNYYGQYNLGTMSLLSR